VDLLPRRHLSGAFLLLDGGLTACFASTCVPGVCCFLLCACPPSWRAAVGEERAAATAGGILPTTTVPAFFPGVRGVAGIPSTGGRHATLALNLRIFRSACCECCDLHSLGSSGFLLLLCCLPDDGRGDVEGRDMQRGDAPSALLFPSARCLPPAAYLATPAAPLVTAFLGVG